VSNGIAESPLPAAGGGRDEPRCEVRHRGSAVAAATQLQLTSEKAQDISRFIQILYVNLIFASPLPAPVSPSQKTQLLTYQNRLNYS
jgi:hypothetical protein